MKCPRRLEGPVFKVAPEDKYRDDDTCDYCGSFNPDSLMARLEAGDVEVGPTDKSYKIYLENNGGKPFKMTYREGCVPPAKCTGPDDCTHWVTKERSHSKFYFQHFSEAQCKRFIELYNEKKIKVGSPGYFYVSPFFCSKEGK